jgi:hypothetical protein
LEVAAESEGGCRRRSMMRLSAVDGDARLDKPLGSVLEWTERCFRMVWCSRKRRVDRR